MSDEDIRAHRYTRLQREFEAIFMTHGGPRDAAMFSNQDPARDHEFYFSPGALRIAGDIIRRYGGAPCETPSQSEAALLVGEADARRLLARDRGNN
jgi:hypothetical protein